MISSFFLLIIAFLVGLFLWPILTGQDQESFVSRPGIIKNIMTHRSTPTPNPGFFDFSPYYNYSYLLGNPYGYYYRYPFYEQEAHGCSFPYYHSYAIGLQK